MSAFLFAFHNCNHAVHHFFILNIVFMTILVTSKRRSLKMKLRKLVALALASAAVVSGCTASVTPPVETAGTEAAEEVLDVSSIRAQDDFYGYVNASNLIEADIENDGSTGSFEQIDDLIDERLDGIIDEIKSADRDSFASGSNEQIIYDAYYQALDASTGGSPTNEEDIAYIDSMAASILNVSTIEEYLDICGTLYKEWGVNPLFGDRIDTDINNSASGSIIIVPFESPTGDELEDVVIGGYSAQSVASSIKFALITYDVDPGDAEQRSISDAQMIMDIAYATDFDTLETINEDWIETLHIMQFKTNDQIDELCPNIGISGIMRTYGLTDTPCDGVYIIDEEQLVAIDSMITEDNLECWKDIALMAFANAVADYLPEDYGGVPVLYSNDMYARTVIKMDFANQLGEEYVERYYDEQAVEEVTEMTHSLVNEYVDIINECEWLSEEGKVSIINKLNSMEYFIGADEPHAVDPLDADLIGNTLFQTIRNMNVRGYEEQIDKLTNGVERNGFVSMSPQTVNACYMPDMNSINITLGIMNDPFYSTQNDYWQNLGGIGAVVGHEISHAFDNIGMNYDMNGNYNPDWMPEEDREAFDQMAQHVSEYYSNQTILDIHNVDGELTLPENLADISGVECILRLADNNDQRQEILENYATIWASVSPKDSALELLYSDSHSPNITRVNAVVALFDCFYEIYDVQEGDGMYVAPEDRVTRW